MFQSHLVDLDELVQTVRDLNSREYIAEAIAAYRSRAYRSAIMGTWIAVAYDIISKIRELAVQGDMTASVLVTKLDAAIAQQTTNYVQAVQHLQAIENCLLNIALNDFEFITPQDYTDLERLKQDRNLCAHPAFTTQATLFQPSPELVRTHLVHAIGHLLQHPPAQGKNALTRLKADLLQPSFPSDQKTTNEFMEVRYLNYAKRAFLDNLVTVFLKILIKQSASEDLVGRETSVLRCLIAFAIRRPEIFERKMSEQMPRLTSGSDDAELKRTFILFKADRRCWTWLENPTRIKMIGIVKTYAYDPVTIDLIMGALEIDLLRPLLVGRIASFSDKDKEAIFSSHQRQEFIDQAIDLYAKVEHFRDAVRIGQTVISPFCSLFRAEHVQRILEAARTNFEIHGVLRTSDILIDIFKATADLLEATKGSWQGFLAVMMNGKERDDRSAYPALRAEMEKAGIWPV